MLPSHFYKYRDAGARTKEIFQSGALWFAAPESFNDPFDCGFEILCAGAENQQIHEAMAFQLVRERMPELSIADAVDAAKEIGARLVESKLTESTENFHKKLSRDTNEKVGILSLTQKRDDILMWSHYADSHAGLCIEYSTNVGFFSEARPVQYSDEYPSLNLVEVVTSGELRGMTPWILTKAAHWRYEQEWRVLDFKGEGARHYPPESLTGVILGCQMPASKRDEVLGWIPAGVQVIQARRSSSHFRLEFESLE